MRRVIGEDGRLVAMVATRRLLAFAAAAGLVTVLASAALGEVDASSICFGVLVAGVTLSFAALGIRHALSNARSARGSLADGEVGKRIRRAIRHRRIEDVRDGERLDALRVADVRPSYLGLGAVQNGGMAVAVIALGLMNIADVGSPRPISIVGFFLGVFSLVFSAVTSITGIRQCRTFARLLRDGNGSPSEGNR